MSGHNSEIRDPVCRAVIISGGVVSLFALMPSSGREVGGLHLTRPLGGHDRVRDLPPNLESFPHLMTVFGSGKTMTARSKVLGDETICGEKSVGLPWGFEPLHALFPLARRLVQVFRVVVEIATLAMFHTPENLPLRSAVASEFIRDDHPRHVRQARKELAEKLLRGPLVPPALHRDVEHMAILIHGTPQKMALAVDGE